MHCVDTITQSAASILPIQRGQEFQQAAVSFAHLCLKYSIRSFTFATRPHTGVCVLFSTNFRPVAAFTGR